MGLQTTMTSDPSCPLCSRCGQITRIYGIEQHPQYTRTDVCTFVCDGCETVEVRIIPNATVN
jgi:hypothetical protein